MKRIIAIITIMVLTVADVLFIGTNFMKVIAEESEIIKEELEQTSQITKQVYKGYLYQGTQKQTEYEEKIVATVSDLENTSKIEIRNQEENYVVYPEGADKISYETGEDIFIKETKIAKENFLEMLGEEGRITIKNQTGEEIAEITKETETKEEGNIVISYEEGQVNKMTIETTKPIKEGHLIFHHKKAISSHNHYEKTQFKQFQALEETIMINEEMTTLQMNLLDTKPEAKIEMTKTQLSTLRRNENIQMTTTLKSNQIQYDLYKNPSVEIIFPAHLEIEVKSVNPVNSPFMAIKVAQLTKNEKGETVVQLQLEGEQTEFENTVAEGIQIVMTLDIGVDILTPSQREEITMRYTNENRENEVNEVKLPIEIQSKAGAFLVSRISNYNQKGETIENTNDKMQIGQLESGVEKRTANVEYYMINNQQTPMKQITMVGKIEGNIGVTLADGIESSKEGAKIYYTEEEQADDNSKSWKENCEDISAVKAFKIVYESEEIAPQERIRIYYPIQIPENLQANQATAHTLTVYYEQEEKPMTITTTNQLQTPTRMFSKVETTTENDEPQAEIPEEISVQMAAVSAGKVLKEGDEICEGQTIRYTLQVTNLKETPIERFHMVATHSNVIYYGEKLVESYDGIQYPHLDEQQDLTHKEITIDVIQPGETVTLEYQIVAGKEVEEGAETTGEIVFSGEGISQTKIKAYSNPIQQGKLRLKLLCGFSMGQRIESNHYAYPLELYVENLTEEELSNIDLELDIKELLGFETNRFEYLPKEINCVLNSVQNNKLKFHIESLAKKQEATLLVLCYTKSIDVNLPSEELKLSYQATVGEETYNSNELIDTIYQSESNITAVQTGSIEGEYVKNEDELTYTTIIKNEGTIDRAISISDALPTGVEIQDAYILKEGERQEVSNIVYPSVYHDQTLKPNEEIILVIETKIDTNLIEGDSITNIVNVGIIESNEVTYQIQKEKPEDPDNPDHPDLPEEIEKGIYGTAWIDENSDGVKDSIEGKISDIEVYLFNQEDGSEVAQTKTNETGDYSFENLKSGKYFVVFNYDNTRYQVTQYQKQGVSSSKNSDVIEKQIELGGKSKKVAMTEGLELSDKNLINIDAGFIKGKIFDLKIEKSIRKVTVQSLKGTTTYEYGKTPFAKMELKSKDIEGSTVLVEYQMEIKNEGELPGYASEIIDYLPSDLQWKEQDNKNWYQTKEGTCTNKELANQIINPGETKTVTLVLTKKMTQNNTGTSVNIAEVKAMPIEPTMGDKKENSSSKAELIISIATGEQILQISLWLIGITILGIGIYEIKKRVIKNK